MAIMVISSLKNMGKLVYNLEWGDTQAA